MKKLLSIILVLVLLIITSVCYAENNVALYEEKLKGTSWLILKSPSSGTYDKTITFIDTTTITDVNSKYKLNDIPLLTGDETGEVYLTIIGSTYDVCGRITLTADERFMILYPNDNSSVILVKK